MLKRIIAASAVLMLALTMAACSQTSETEATKPSTSTSPVGTTATPTVTNPPASSSAVSADFEEITLADNENILFKITGVENDPIWGYTLKVYMENKTDKELMFTLADVSVNGFMCDPFWAETVSAGKKSNSSIFWMSSSFEDNGITAVQEITLTLRAYDNNDWLADDIHKETYVITP